ncbi:MAG TPA: glycoside hydrolase family 2 [Candidatus Mediterraneibacter ornithocaccae]|nr:glycoside hydrolase family 2 [Candidatus Mediterraneibacter ornithocaccae]
MTAIPRSEHPRPDFERDNWMCLNGEWDFSLDEKKFDRTIIVPFAFETELSGIGDKEFHKMVWYRKTFKLPERMKAKRVILHFGAVDYACDLWVNGTYIREHKGGQTSFSADITEAVAADDENVIELKVFDDYEDMEMPRGKQFWEQESRGIFYTRTTGIWQSVWIEAVEPLYLEFCYITPEFDDKCVCFEYRLSRSGASAVEFSIAFEGKFAACVSAVPNGKKGMVKVQLDQTGLKSWNFEEELAWTPETPRLFDVEIRIYDEKGVTDLVRTYFGMRKVSIDNGKFMLNNREYYQKLVLDQGYWEESLLTAPSDEAFIKDIELTKAMGFNGVRKHQKVEDPRYLYHADRLGLLVWGELGSAYLYSREYAGRMYTEWIEAVKRDYNHPCIVAWTPLNESWGVQEIKADKYQQAHCNALMYMIKSVDTSRVVIDNDGWEHTCGDLLTIHDYTASGKVLKKHFESLEAVLSLCPGRRSLFADGWSYQGQPVLLTEFGGVRYVPGTEVKHSWGYCDASSAEEFADKYAEIMKAVHESPVIQGYCYTQLTDVEAEENGLLTYQRGLKIPLEKIRAINEGYRK